MAEGCGAAKLLSLWQLGSRAGGQCQRKKGQNPDMDPKVSRHNRKLLGKTIDEVKHGHLMKGSRLLWQVPRRCTSLLWGAAILIVRQEVSEPKLTMQARFLEQSSHLHPQTWSLSKYIGKYQSCVLCPSAY